MRVAILTVLFSALAYLQFPAIWKQKGKIEIVLYLSLIFIDLVLSICQVLQIHLPIISEGIVYLFGPLKEMVDRSLK
jgi:hypothetical protein